ncbi:MAG: hypothetical protein JXD22_13650 [Sedimentisphaerales bacterium]|nr:hypothetical protein [Sedimentisphaerales bacterium]
MKTINVSDEIYEKLKGFVVDPFDDSPDVVIGRVVDIANKAKSRWSPFDSQENPEPQPQYSYNNSCDENEQDSQELEVIL